MADWNVRGGLTSDSSNNVFPQSSLPSADRSSTNGPAGGSISMIEGEPIAVALRNAAGAVVGTKRITGYPKHYNIRGNFDGYGRPFDTYSITIEQRLGGQQHLVSAYVMRDQKIWNQQVRFRLGGRNLVDLENSQTRRTGTTTLANGIAIYRVSYVMPPQYDLTATVRF